MELAADYVADLYRGNAGWAKNKMHNLRRVEARKVTKKVSTAYTAGMIECAMTLYLMNAFVSDAAVDWLIQRKKALGYAVASADDLANQVEDWFLQADGDDMEMLMNPLSPQQEKRYQNLSGWYLKWRLSNWVRNSNQDKGVEPDTEQCMREMDTEYLMLEAPLILRSNLGVGKNRVFAHRWRKSFDVSLGSVPTRPDMTEATTRNKVCLFWVFLDAFFMKMGCVLKGSGSRRK